VGFLLPASNWFGKRIATPGKHFSGADERFPGAGFWIRFVLALCEV
jgi:hypothetical protein